MKKQHKQLIILSLLAGAGYYFLIYLSEKRNKAKAEIMKLFNDNPSISLNSLDTNIWKGASNWEEFLDSCYFSSQINLFVRQIKEIVKKIRKEREEKKSKLREAKEQAIRQIEDICDKVFGEEREEPSIEKALEKFTKEINKTSADNLSTVIEEAQRFIYGERDKIKRLYWKLPDYNWADRWLKRNRSSFSTAWQTMSKLLGEEPRYFDAKAIYKISFPPLLWNELNEEQQILAKNNGHGELRLRDEVSDYHFNDLIIEWEEKAVQDPIRGEQNANNPAELDNNAIFYGAPRTGKSIMAEKLAYEADIYPLVVIQGSTLTPKKADVDSGVTLLLKFIFTISAITYDLVENYGFERKEDGEAPYILFIDEADQICMNNFDPPRIASSQLTFLKECMGSDNKDEESKNLWIAATNHLDNINEAVYQSGRFSNPLCFSWTLNTFKYYAEQEGIVSQFPKHWTDTNDLNSDDIKHVNRFNKILFDKYFIGKGRDGVINHDKSFWNKFIEHTENQEQLNEIKEEEVDKETGEVIIDEQTGKPKEIIKQKGIQLGEFFEFFWQKYDNKEIEEFDGKFTKPQKPKIEEVVDEVVKLAANKIANDISKAIDTRLRELKEIANETRVDIQDGQNGIATAISQGIEELANLLAASK
ncbi:MAG: ATP-dependent zinc metalloprotease FtsH [Mycoplasmataceae bacterium]|nr:MAG: ATP-dependent zinc metalloprotease FtsH [Mycoplasmataceae bacterium]